MLPPVSGMFHRSAIRSYCSFIDRACWGREKGSRNMQVLCKTSNEQMETCCSVCGQGFALFWERPNRRRNGPQLFGKSKRPCAATTTTRRARSTPAPRFPGSGMDRPGRFFRRGHAWQCTQLGTLSILAVVQIHRDRLVRAGQTKIQREPKKRRPASLSSNLRNPLARRLCRRNQ